ncbi:MAG TPA: cytochrome o ubiquinol oxidase subunit IV [Steroidobacteraceae bacterium]|nr:cytochrome o ubiquinol oxidase subunit IV [Steroidobacteraceae bacterium]
MSVANDAFVGRAPHGAIHPAEQGSGHGAHGTRKSYISGFLLAIALTVVPFGLVMTHSSVGTPLIITVFALAQIGVHIVYFLHVRPEEQSWNLMALIFTAIVVCIILGGSVWIMHNLYLNMMPGMMQAPLG